MSSRDLVLVGTGIAVLRGERGHGLHRPRDREANADKAGLNSPNGALVDDITYPKPDEQKIGDEASAAGY